MKKNDTVHIFNLLQNFISLPLILIIVLDKNGRLKGVIKGILIKGTIYKVLREWFSTGNDNFPPQEIFGNVETFLLVTT